MKRFLSMNVVFVLSLTTSIHTQQARANNTPASTNAGPRFEMPLRDGWSFKLGPDSTTELQGDTDATWTSVSVPHTWNRVGYYKDAPASHINTAQNVVTTQGVGWYRLTFTPPAAVTGMESFLQFDAASRMATVWLNGVLLGTHKGGFSRFRLDSTASLKVGQKNILTVKVDNTKPALGTFTADILPLTGDFFVYSGLYRPVSLVFTRKTHLDLMDYGSSGYRAACERSRTSLLVLTQHPCARSSAELVLRMSMGELEADGNVLTGLSFAAEIERQRFAAQPANIVSIRKPPQRKRSGVWKGRMSWAV